MMTYMSLSVVMIDLGNLRGQMFSHTLGSPLMVTCGYCGYRRHDRTI